MRITDEVRKAIARLTAAGLSQKQVAEKNGSPKIDWEDVLCMVKA